jgi:hypothetical protein
MVGWLSCSTGPMNIGCAHERQEDHDGDDTAIPRTP